MSGPLNLRMFQLLIEHLFKLKTYFFRINKITWKSVVTRILWHLQINFPVPLNLLPSGGYGKASCVKQSETTVLIWRFVPNRIIKSVLKYFFICLQHEILKDYLFTFEKPKEVQQWDLIYPRYKKPNWAIMSAHILKPMTFCTVIFFLTVRSASYKHLSDCI